jgi:hypothetical protein
MTFKMCLRSSAAALAMLASGAVNAEVTVLGWPGGPEEAALRAVTEVYNAKADLAEKTRSSFCSPRAMGSSTSCRSTLQQAAPHLTST